MKRINSIHKLPNVPGEVFKKDWPSWYKDSRQSIRDHCLYCGNILPKRKRSYCSDKCRIASKCAVHDLQITSLRRYIHRWFDFECQDCNFQFYFKTPAGVCLPLHSGEVHHIIPLELGGPDSFENLTLLCEHCHKKRHRKLNDKGMLPNPNIIPAYSGIYSSY